MTMKQFRTSAKNADPEAPIGEPLTVDIDEREITFLPPTSGQIAILLAGSDETHTDMESAAALINFFFSMIESDSDSTYMRKRLFDRRDPFGIDEISELIDYVMGEWSATPTRRPSDYLPSQRTTGRRSTPVRHRTASTPSA